MRSILTMILVLLSVAWIAATTYYFLNSWPTMPLDLGKDAKTLAAYNNVVTMHALRYAAIGLMPPLLLWAVISWAATRR